MKRKSLIALVIAMVIIIVLAGVVILKLADKNPIKDTTGADKKTTKEATAEDVEADPEKYYGAYVNYVPKNGCKVNWRVFYADDTNIYLIAEDCVPNSYLTATGLTKSAELSVESNYKEYCVYSDISRKDLVERLTTSSYYSEFKDLAGKASSVVGAPTLEMYKNSYNAVNTGIAKQMDILNCTAGQSVVPGLDEHSSQDDDKTNSEGYVLRFENTGNYAYYIIMPDDANKMKLYIGTDSTKADAMWLASFSASDTRNVMCAYCGGSVNRNFYDNPYMGLRPLVTLNSNVKLVDLDGDGTYDLE